jgi:hypothetical protein
MLYRKSILSKSLEIVKNTDIKIKKLNLEISIFLSNN